MNEFEKDYGLTGEKAAIAKEFMDALIKQTPENQMIDPLVYQEVCHSRNALRKLLKSSDESAKTRLVVNAVASMVSLEAEISALDVYDMELFVDVIGIADIFYIHPLDDGKLKLQLIFEHAMIPI